MRQEVEALIHVVIAIVLLTLGVNILISPEGINNNQSITIIVFSTLYTLYCYKDKIVGMFNNKDDT